VPAIVRVTLAPATLHHDRTWHDTGPAVQAAFLHAVRRTDPRTAEHLHDAPGPRPYSISPLLGTNTAEHARGIRIGLLDDRLIPTVVTAMETNVAWRIGNSTFTVDDLAVAAVHWTDLYIPSDNARWRMTMLTPTALRWKTRTTETIWPFPEPRALLDSLARRWNTHATNPIEPDDIEDAKNTTNITAAELTITPHLTVPPRGTRNGATTDGALGWVRFETEAPTTVAKLLALAYFAGAGSQTTKGMGVVDITAI